MAQATKLLCPTFFQELSAIRDRWKGPRVQFGDFNSIRFHSERKGSGCNPSTSEGFNDLIARFQVFGIKQSQLRYAWPNYHEVPSLSKLDRRLVCLNWLDLSPLALLTRLPKTMLDHFPLRLDAMPQLSRNKPSRFEDFWCTTECFDDLIGDW